MRDDSKTTWLEVVGVVAIFALIALLLVLVVRQSSANECVAGGYAAYRIVKGEPLCIGVNSDGEWHLETWRSVQERLGER